MNHCGIKDDEIELNFVPTVNLEMKVEVLSTDVDILTLIDTFSRVMLNAYKSQHQVRLYNDDLFVMYSKEDYKLMLMYKKL